jgi:hypothetical protein
MLSKIAICASSVLGACISLVTLVIVTSCVIDTNSDIKILIILGCIFIPLNSITFIIDQATDICEYIIKKNKNAGIQCIKLSYFITVISIGITCIVCAGRQYSLLIESGLSTMRIIFGYFIPLALSGVMVIINTVIMAITL